METQALNKYTHKKGISINVMDIEKTSVYREFIALKEEVLKHKWYESERKGYDVGFPYALIDWTIKFKTQWFKQRHPAISH